MLSISNIGSHQASTYYKKDGYYCRLNDSDNSWQGKLKDKLGLSDAVVKEEFDLLVGTNKERAGYDLCFSAPKSVSIAMCLDEATRNDMLAAHEAANGRAVFALGGERQQQQRQPGLVVGDDAWSPQRRAGQDQRANQPSEQYFRLHDSLLVVSTETVPPDPVNLPPPPR